MKKTKLIATLGPKSDTREVIQKEIEAGVNVVRLNMSHGDYDEQMNRINIVREINEELGTYVGILLDTKGPEVRTGLFENEKVELVKGKDVIITMEDVMGTAEKFTVSYKGLANDVKAGDIILLDDGYVSVLVKSTDGTDITCEILNTGMMKDRRGVNVPGVTLAFEFMSEKDRNDIIWACENNLDYIAASFVRNQQDLMEILEVIKETGNETIKVLPKIESQDGVDNFDEILEKSDGIMVARGDLGVEVPAEMVPVCQKEIIAKCNEAGKFVVTATQMLESMQSNPRPTRAEVSDVFNAVTDGSDAVMLSGESAAGDYPVEAVATQAKIAAKAEEVFDYTTYLAKKNQTLKCDVNDLVSYSAVAVADKIENVQVIIAVTNSGETARRISRLKPRTPILAVTPSKEVARTLALNFGVIPAVMEQQNSIDELLDSAIEKAKELGLVVTGQDVVISAGSINGKGNTDLMKIRTVK